MELEEHSIEELPERCESCGAALTEPEKQRILDEGSALLVCAICAAEAVATGDEDPEEGGAAY